MLNTLYLRHHVHHKQIPSSVTFSCHQNSPSMIPFLNTSTSGGAMQRHLEGRKVEMREDYGGLGFYYAEKLYQNMEKVHQVDTVTGVTETGGSLRARAFQIAQQLRQQGLLEKDIVVVCSRCHADQTAVVLACLMLGCILAPLDPAMHHTECIELVSQLRPKMCFCDLRTLKQMERVVAETGLDVKMVHFSDQQQYAMAFSKLLTGCHAGQFAPVRLEQPRKKVAFVLPTQGATGPPKLVCLSHHFIYCQTMILLGAMSCPLKLLSLYPLSCLIQVVLTCVSFEMSIVRVLTGAFVERPICKLIQEMKIDHVFLSTDLALRLVEHVAVKDFNISCLKCIFVGSTSTSANDFKKLTGRFPRIRFAQFYCTTETGVTLASTPSIYTESLEKVGSIGKVMPNYRLRVINVETMKDLGSDSVGELLIASDCLMLGYFKNLNITKSMMCLGYFKTGDLVTYDAAGWFYLRGRVEDMIEINGNKISSRELEDIILQHPFVKDTAVVGNNKEVVACVIIKEDAKLTDNKLLTFISERTTAKTVPDRIVFMEDFPTTPQGKIKRDKLREEVLEVKIEHSESILHATENVTVSRVNSQSSKNNVDKYSSK